jgi:hypothetical protein
MHDYITLLSSYGTDQSQQFKLYIKQENDNTLIPYKGNIFDLFDTLDSEVTININKIIYGIANKTKRGCGNYILYNKKEFLYPKLIKNILKHEPKLQAKSFKDIKHDVFYIIYSGYYNDKIGIQKSKDFFILQQNWKDYITKIHIKE